jgi:hypothetical protein
MNLTETQRQWAIYAVREVIALRRLGDRKIPPGVIALDRALWRGAEDELANALTSSDNGTACDRCREYWCPDDLIGPEEAAQILGCSARYVRKIASDLDGRLVGAMWVFHRPTVVAHAQAKGEAHEAN